MFQFSLKRKIFMGFGIIVTLLFSNALVVYFGSKRMSQEMVRMAEIEDIRAAVLEMDRDVQELRLRSDGYVHAGRQSQADAVNELIVQLNTRIETITGHCNDRDMEVLFDKIKTRLEQYAMNFEDVTIERKLRQNLVDDQLPKLTQQIVAESSATMDLLESSEFSSDSRLELIHAQSAFAQADNFFLRYFENPDGHFAESAIRAIEKTLSHLDRVGELTQQIESIKQSVRNYEKIGFRAVQATRSYLFLRNVVIAGEESEVSYYSGKLRASAKQRREQIAAELAASSEQVRSISWAIVFTACGLSLLIAMRLAILIVTPISELTKTFEVLSSGNVLSKIPGTEREDEIGKMANAASIFSDQNSRTRELLKQSRALSEELQQKACELESINEELDNFAYVASHDLRSPLRGIKHLAEWIEDDVQDSLSEEGASYLDNLIARVGKLEVLLEDLLDFSRVGRLNATPEEVSIESVLQNIVEMVSNEDGVDIQWPDDLPTLTTIRTPLEQVFMNLIGNAIKHNDKGSEGTVQVSWSLQNDRYHFSVMDNGPGIAQSNFERIFQMYQRVGDSSIEGSGMGLAIVKKQVEYHGGKVTVESELDKGACFHFSWPCTTEFNSLEPAEEAING